jgi:type VI secretion system Hcp family effector
MQSRLFREALLLVLSCGTFSLMAQRAESFGGTIDIQGSRTKITGTLTDATAIMTVTKRNVASTKGQTITVERESDAASPKLYQAVSTNEVLPKVIFKVFKPGDPTKYKIITLENALITKVSKGTKPPGTAKPNTDTHEKEEIAFTFTKISVEFFGGSTSTTDDWTANNQ